MSPGNSKLGETMNISLPPGLVCPNWVPCRDKCYALKIARRWRSTGRLWLENYRVYIEYPMLYFDEIARQLDSKNPKWFRWHVSGDIVDQDYYKGMCGIARQFPNTNFLVFTKRYDLDFRGRPHNLSVVFSTWPGLELPKKNFPKFWMLDKSRKETRIPENAVECRHYCPACRMCWRLSELGHDIWIEEH